jgi:ribosomal protein L37AE/L43A
MAKRPTPKQRLCKDRSGNRHGAYLRKQWKKLRNQMNSPYCRFAVPKQGSGKALEKITKIKA